MPIFKLSARQIYDSVGTPTVEAEIITEVGLFRSSVPSTDVRKPGEAVQLRDVHSAQNDGLGVRSAVKNINTIIAPELINSGLLPSMQREIDGLLCRLDGSDNKSRLGANAILAVSMVCARAGAGVKNLPLYKHISELANTSACLLPCPHIPILTGGVMSTNLLPFLEYTIIPVGAATFAEAMKMATEIYKHTKEYGIEKYGIDTITTCDSGAISVPFPEHKDAVVFLNDAINNLGYQGRIELGLNATASDFYTDEFYNLTFKHPPKTTMDLCSGDKLAEMYNESYKEYNVSSIEDGLDPVEWPIWARMVTRGLKNFQILANDLTASNMKRITLAIERKTCTAIALRLNQIGTVTEFIDTFKYLKSNDVVAVVIDRTGETTDSFIADLTVGLSVGQIKCGAPAHGERLAKYNQILRIEEDLGAMARFAGRKYKW